MDAAQNILEALGGFMAVLTSWGHSPNGWYGFVDGPDGKSIRVVLAASKHVVKIGEDGKLVLVRNEKKVYLHEGDKIVVLEVQPNGSGLFNAWSWTTPEDWSAFLRRKAEFEDGRELAVISEELSVQMGVSDEQADMMPPLVVESFGSDVLRAEIAAQVAKPATGVADLVPEKANRVVAEANGARREAQASASAAPKTATGVAPQTPATLPEKYLGKQVSLEMKAVTGVKGEMGFAEDADKQNVFVHIAGNGGEGEGFSEPIMRNGEIVWVPVEFRDRRNFEFQVGDVLVGEVVLSPKIGSRLSTPFCLKKFVLKDELEEVEKKMAQWKVEEAIKAATRAAVEERLSETTTAVLARIGGKKRRKAANKRRDAETAAYAAA